MQFRVLAALPTLLLGACAMSELLPSSSPPEEAAGPEPYYRYVIAAGITAVVGPVDSASIMQISGVRLVDSLKGPAWLACVQMDRQGVPRFFAVYIQRHKISESRMSVLTDRCEAQSYIPFNWQLERAMPPQQ